MERQYISKELMDFNIKPSYVEYQHLIPWDRTPFIVRAKQQWIGMKLVAVHWNHLGEKVVKVNPLHKGKQTTERSSRREYLLYIAFL